MTFDVRANGYDLQFRAASREHAIELIQRTLPNSAVDWESLKATGPQPHQQDA